VNNVEVIVKVADLLCFVTTCLPFVKLSDSYSVFGIYGSTQVS